jgi:hypothetical protein
MRAVLQLDLHDRDGRLRARRRAHNAVMKSGAQLIAELFTGQGTGITHMGVGTSDTPESDTFATTALTNAAAAGQPALTGDTEVELPAGAFTNRITIDEGKRLAQVRFHATLPEAAAVGTVREAGLLAHPADGGDAVLYNRVIFAPVPKGDDHELTLFWEVSFPYGDLQWLQ